MYRQISANKPLNNNLKFTVVILVLLSTSVITPIIVNLIQTEKRIDKNYHYNIPALKPPVEYAAPDAFKPPNSLRRLDAVPYEFSLENELKQRFFTEEGPSSIYWLLQSVDGRTQEINSRGLENERQCLGMEPIEINVEGWPGEDPMPIWVQCYDIFDSNNYFMLFGRKDDMIYLYEKGPTTTTVAFINTQPREHTAGSPCCYQVNGGGDDCVCDNDVCVNVATNDTNGGKCRTIPDGWPVPPTVTNNTNTSSLFEPSVDYSDINLYFSVGAGYTSTQTGSRGLVHLEAKPRSGFLQVTAAGIGLGFCGVQFVTDHDKILAAGSMDGPGGTCLVVNETCATSDLATSLSVEDCALGFSMIPLGRTATTDFRGQFTFNEWETSYFPGGELNNVDISNTATASVNFGPASVPDVLVSLGRNFNQ